METLFAVIAVLCYAGCAMRILCFDHRYHHRRKIFEILAVMLIAALMAQSVNIIFLKDPVTIFDVFFAVLLGVVVFRSKGNVAMILKFRE